MADYRAIYAAADSAALYDVLVSREDREGNILRTLRQQVSLEGARVIEMGAGTGRLTRLLAPHVGEIVAFEGEAAMLEVARADLARRGMHNVELHVADNAKLPAEDASADLTIAGWTFGHATGWYPDAWRGPIGAMLDEARRVTRAGGAIVVLETLGTGRTEPAAPRPELADYYAMMEQERRFTRHAIRTDYEFASLAEAESLVRFFFGDTLAHRVIEERLLVLPECTGIWIARRLPA
jgi:ubiquinone/menaquinone biosynthesis C-methylase UbiE